MLPSPFNVKQLAELPSIHEIEATQGGATPRRAKHRPKRPKRLGLPFNRSSAIDRQRKVG